MTESEVRIGNLVLCSGIVTEIKSIYDQGINLEISGDYYGAWKCEYDGYFYYNWFTGALIEPIPLTEEWLLKFGFTKIEKSNEIYWTFWVKGNVHVSYVKEDNGAYYEQTGFCNKHVHQLQNLFFALTGMELEVASVISS